MKTKIYFLSAILLLINACTSASLDPSNSDTSLDTSNGLSFSHLPQNNEAGVYLDSNITISFTKAIDETTVNNSSVILTSQTGNIPATIMYDSNVVTINPIDSLQAATLYNVTITTDITELNKQPLDVEYSWSFTTASGNTAPDISLWESKMIEIGTYWGEILMNYTDSDLSSSPARNNVYYDGQRIFFQIADYTGQSEPWNTYAQRAEEIMRDKYYIPSTYNIPGYKRFSHGMYMDFLRTGDQTSAEGVVSARDAPSFSNPDISGYASNWYAEGYSREIAYAISANILAERLGHARNETRMSLYIDMALNHINEWVTDVYSSDNHRIAPFMVGLACEALIEYYEWEVEQGNNPDETIPLAIKSIADHLMVAKVKSGTNTGAPMWVSNVENTGYGAFRYEDKNAANPAPVLNLLIAPLYAWTYKHFEDQKYLNMGDLIWQGGVNLSVKALDDAGKMFNQNYRWSFNYIKWRNEGQSN